MAENKKSVLLYCDIIHTVKELSDEEAGKLFKHYLMYINDLNPVAPDKLTKIVFEPIKQNLKRDLIKWVDIKTDRSDAGNLGNLKRWNIDLYDDVIKGIKTLEESLTIAKGRTATKPIANIAVKVKVKDTVKVKDKETNNVSIETIDFDSLIKFFNETFKKQSKVISDVIKKKYILRLKVFKKEDIFNAMKNAAKDSFHIDNNFKHCTLEFFSRADKIDNFSSRTNINDSPYNPDDSTALANYAAAHIAKYGQMKIENQ